MSLPVLQRLAREWRRQTILRSLLVALAAGQAGFAAALGLPGRFHWEVPLSCLVAAFAVSLGRRRPWRVDAAHLSRHLDRTCPELEESTALCLRPRGDLSLLERLQLQRLEARWQVPPTLPDADLPLGAPPRHFLRGPTLSLAAAGLLMAAAGLIRLHHPTLTPKRVGATPAGPPPAPVAVPEASVRPRIVSNRCQVLPPAYTGHPPRDGQGLAIEAEEGSRIIWRLALDRPVQGARLVAGNAAVPLTLTPDRTLTGEAVVRDTTLFSLSTTLPDGTAWNPPELFSVTVRKDLPPTVRLVQPASPRTEIDPPATAPVSVEVEVSDDYAVAEAHLVATVAKGTGEAVKFREQTISLFSADPADKPADRRFTTALDLSALGLEPGDELYFFVEAHDNRQPTANRTRSETRFLHLRGPDAKPATTGRGVAGVNLVPQYFRSERQLILDTEKLLAERPTLSAVDFRTRANDLGQDQALLRLRYGRFLGEDQEESALTDHLDSPENPLQAPPPERPAGPGAAASIAARFRQEHAGQDLGGGGEDGPPRAPADGTPPSAEQIRQPFVDTHDLHDKNTFFDNRTQGTMRDALTAMWQAERFLRTARLQEALAPENRALEILKDLQSGARAYVQHVGFEAPPIKVAERRLKGETTGVPALSAWPDAAPPDDPAATDLRTALRALSLQASPLLADLARIEPPLTAAATRQPDVFLPGLQALRRLQAPGGARADDDVAAVQSALLRLLPPARAQPDRREEAAPGLAAPYLRALRPPEDRP